MDLGPTGGHVWRNAEQWRRRLRESGCVICRDGAPLDIIAESPAIWVTAQPDAPLPHYACAVSKRHVVEPFELSPDDQATFWTDVMLAARGIHEVSKPIKMNYEIHGNTLPHLHLHIFPRHPDDPFVGGPIDPRRASTHRTPDDLRALADAVSRWLAPRA